MKRLIEWDQVDVRIDGAKANEIVAQFRVDPIERMEVSFYNGFLRVTGSIRKFISVPFTVEVREIGASGTTIRVPVAAASAFGGLPIPRFLFGLVREQLPRELVRYEEPATFVISLDRFLPSFVDADVQKIWIIDGGLAVTLGRGGADLPPNAEVKNGSSS